jgi:hypothetical protein
MPLRIVLHDPVAAVWHPLFTGELETCTTRSAGGDVVRIADLVAVDTVSSRLAAAQLIDYELDPDDVGLDIDDAVAELLAYAAWPYGSVVDVPAADDASTYALLGRMFLGGNVLEQLRRIADTVGRVVSADRFGRLAFVRRSPQIVTYSNAYTTATDPNAPDPLTVDSADVIADTVQPTPAPYARVTDVKITQAWRPGIYGPATIGPYPQAPVRRISGQNATVSRGLMSASTQAPASVNIPDEDHEGWQTVTASAPGTRNRLGRREIALTDMVPMIWGEFVGQQIADNLVGLYSGDLFVVPFELDDRHVDTIAAIRVGQAITFTHDGATFTGTIGRFRVDSTPLQNSCRLRAAAVVHATEIERP